MPSIDLPLGTIDYRVYGPADHDAPTAVMVHGFLVNGTLWHDVATRLAAAGVRCVVPDWPLGSHRRPVPGDRGLSLNDLAPAVLDLLDRLGLREVALVGNDTGGAIVQLALRGDHRRIGSVVLTNCDAFETLPPAYFVPLFALGRHPLAVTALTRITGLRPIRNGPAAYGTLYTGSSADDLTETWIAPARSDPAIRRDITRFCRELDRRALVNAADWLSTFERPVRLVWGARDRNFTPALARRLAATFPDAALVEVPDATTFIPVDRPQPVASAITAALATTTRRS